jgi:hypothetical protein
VPDDDLSKGGRAAAGLLARAGAVFVAGFLAAHAIAAAQASTPLDIRQELAAMHDDILLIKCRLGIESRCPPASGPPLRNAGVP